MAQPKRNDDPHESAVPTPAQTVLPSVPSTQRSGEQDYRLGGQVGQMQMDLARRLAIGATEEQAVDPPEERIVRYLSIAGGYTVLVAGYAGLICLFLR